MSVRAKFKLSSIIIYPTGKTLQFEAVHDTSTEENRRFTTATPHGRLEISVDNPTAAEQFEIDKHYYVDFSPAEG